METTYSADVDHIDDAVRAAAAEGPIRVRVQPSLYRKSLGQHRDWSGVSWSITCQDVGEAISLREALRAFFEAIRVYGPDQVMAALQPPRVQ
jgi:hypothetical protein